MNTLLYNETMLKKFEIYPTRISVRYQWQEIKNSAEGYDNSHLYLKSIPRKGLGVFSKKDLKEGDIIELCHSAPIETPSRWMRDSGIKKYSYWDPDGRGLIPFGFGCIYNSADRENLKNITYHMFVEDRLMVFIATKDIPAGEELITWWGEGYYKSWCDASNKPITDN